MPSIGPMELIAVLIVALVILGPKKLPDLGRSLGSGLREFKNSVTGGDDRRELPAAEAPRRSTGDDRTGSALTPAGHPAAASASQIRPDRGA